jgi:RimJ/RimL family protein N-acetyltransferase
VTPEVEITTIDERVLDSLLHVAVADADPDDVMPLIDGPPGWTEARRDAFRNYHRARMKGLEGDNRELGYVVISDGAVVGAARLARRDDGRFEVGVGLGRSARGRGVGTALMGLLLERARDLGGTVVAETTAGNAGALALLRRHGARLSEPHRDGSVHAELP